MRTFPKWGDYEAVRRLFRTLSTLCPKTTCSSDQDKCQMTKVGKFNIDHLLSSLLICSFLQIKYSLEMMDKGHVYFWFFHQPCHCGIRKCQNQVLSVYKSLPYELKFNSKLYFQPALEVPESWISRVVTVIPDWLSRQGTRCTSVSPMTAAGTLSSSVSDILGLTRVSIVVYKHELSEKSHI